MAEGIQHCSSVKHEETEPRIPPELMVPIFQFLPTFELIRFVSACANKPLGKFWSVGLKIVVEQRLPLSLEVSIQNSSMNQIDKEDKASRTFELAKLYDLHGDTLANINRPELFSSSSLVDLIEHAMFTVTLRPNGVGHILDDRIMGIEALSNLRTLKVMVDTSLFHNDSEGSCVPLATVQLLAPELQFILPQLEALSICEIDREEPETLIFAVQPGQLVCLEKLAVSAEQFTAMIPRTPSQTTTILQDAQREMLAQLECLHVLTGPQTVCRQLQQVIPVYSTQLRELVLNVRDEISAYFSIFVALPLLAKLGLLLRLGDGPIWLFDTPEARCRELSDVQAVPSVIELRLSVSEIIYTGSLEPSTIRYLHAMFSKFPNVATLSVLFGISKTVMKFAAEICQAKMLPKLNTIKCFEEEPRPIGLNLVLGTFLADPSLPRNVDLSAMIFLRFGVLDDWLELYRMMQSNQVTSLIVRCPLNVEGLQRFEKLAAKDRVAYGDCKITRQALYDDGTETASFDLKIAGRKTDGVLKGELFVVRFFHTLKRTESIFELNIS